MESTKKLPIEFKYSIEEYNNIPVHYCTKCLSLKVLIYDEITDYCDDCGSTNIATAHIDEVLVMKQNKN